MNKRDQLEAINFLGVALLFILAIVFVIKFMGLVFDSPRDTRMKINIEVINVCVDRGGTPYFEDSDGWYTECRGAK